MGARFVEDAHHAVLATAKELLAKGLVEGTAGNVSARMADGNICITPSSIDYRAMALEDLVVIDQAGDVVSGDKAPSSEKSLHLACYQAFEEVGSVIHSHPVHATMFAVARRPIPACIDEFTVYVGGEVAVTEYAASGTHDVGKAAVECLAGRGAALLANHGMVAIGKSPSDVLHVTALVERSAEILLGAMALGGAVPLPEKSNSDFAGVYQYLRTN
ncbi:MAG TPA: L-fuculose-phosphate aldolase [Acidimicrobiales bacterium]|nr:L-fuculose-phosphate aldolase [Acidimicrobiales bacterium]